METLKALASVFEIEFSAISNEDNMATATAPELEEQHAFLQVRKLKGFYIHLTQYCLMIPLLCIINLLTNPSTLWFIWPALGWGIGLLVHAAAAFEVTPFLGAQWEKRQVEKRLGRPL
nr:2TM domain-containing protein [Corticibacter populi]